MKYIPKILTPPWITLLLGIPAVVCMWILRLTGVDDQGLFTPWHPAAVLIGLLAVVMAAWLIALLLRHPYKPPYRLLFPQSVPAMVGTACGSVAMVSGGLGHIGVLTLDTLFGGIMILGGAAMGVLAWLRHQNRKANALLWTTVTVGLMLRLLISYRSWSAESQLMAYGFPLLGSVCLTLAMYYRAAFSGEIEHPRLYLFFSQMGAFFSLLAISEEPLFYGGMALWALTDVCSLQRMRPKKAAPKEEQP